QRTEQAAVTRIAKSANYAIGSTDLLYLEHRGPFARSVRRLQTFREDPIQVAAGFVKPVGGSPVISGRWRKAQLLGGSEIRTCEAFEKLSTLAQRPLQVRSSILREQIEHDVHCWIRFCEFLNATRGRVQTQL